MAVSNDNIRGSVQILIKNEQGDNNPDHFSKVISMVPSRLRELSPKSFDPRVVLIGPLHHGDENLTRSESWKKCYMRNLLSRLRLPLEQTLEECLRNVNASMHIIKECYARMRPYNDSELARMMVVDCCFILEFIYNYSENKENVLRAQSVLVDLLLAENQVPFFVLISIFECTISKSNPRASLIKHICPLLRFGNIFHQTHDLVINPNSTHHNHILGLLHAYYQPPNINNIVSGFDPLIVHNVVELDKAGVSFKPKKDAEFWPMAMTLKSSRYGWFSWFWDRPTLTMPVLLITEFTELKLRNLIAYEQKCDVHWVASYAMALDLLVDTQEDIATLVKSQVMLNAVGSNEEAAKMVNNICKEVAVNDFLYFEQWKQIDSYYMGYWPRHVAWLKRTYFNSPWNIIALLAGIILFALTAVQTYFTAVNGKE